MSQRTRRAAVLLSLALACGGLAASEMRGRLREVEARVGPLLPVVVARRDVKAGTKLDRAEVARSLVIRRIPQRFAPPDALATTDQALGLRTAVATRRGSYVTLAGLANEQRPERGGELRPGERSVEVAVTGGVGLIGAASVPARVDVVVTTEPRSGPGRTFLALENVQLLGARRVDAAGSRSDRVVADAIATLRLTLRQAVYMAAADNVAHEVRLLARPAGDHTRAGGIAVDGTRL